MERPVEDAPAADGPAESTAEPMARHRPGAPAGMPLARARVFGALFGADSTLGAFGRFRVLDRLGAGGMGVVYEAYDPDLARGVALKLVNVAAKDRDTALAEAKALARLSHPNVVPIYDVGLERDHVYLVMELVRGETLRRWAEGRVARDILAVYQQAGAALAAAHAAGLVHRDFKPDNAIVGADGRVRVVDFGLACEADDPARMTGQRRRVAGTPGFIAPEIEAGAAVTPAADQYSFCVALAGALASATLPRWVAAVLERGRAADPAARFASMTELLHALARDPARAWRRGGAVAGLVALVGALTFLLGRQRASEPDPCEDGPARLEAVWSRTARSTALARVAGLGDYGRSLRPLLERELDEQGERWTQAYRAACVDHRRGTESDAQVDRRNTCLKRSSDALAAVGELITHIEPANLAQLPRAVQSIPDPDVCSDSSTLQSDIVPPPRALEIPLVRVRQAIAQAHVHVGAGRYAQALTEASVAAYDARNLDYPPVLAEALVVQGHARMMLADRRAAIPIFDEATAVAVASRADALAVEAWARRAFLEGTSTGPGGALDGINLIEPLAQRIEGAAFARALLYNNIGCVELTRDREDSKTRARDYFRRALGESRGVISEGALELLTIRANIGMSTEDRVEGDRLLVEVTEERARRLGAEHPDTLESRWLRGTVTIEDLRQAAELLTPVCRAYEQHTTLTRERAQCWTELGLLRWELGESDAAMRALEQAVAVRGDAPEAMPYLTLLRGDVPAAVRQFAEAIAQHPVTPSDNWWDRLSHACLTLGLGRARRAAEDLPGARRALEATVAELQQIVRSHGGTAYERRLGRARVELALVLTGTGASPADRAVAAAAAVAWLRRVGSSSIELEQLADPIRDAAR